MKRSSGLSRLALLCAWLAGGVAASAQDGFYDDFEGYPAGIFPTANWHHSGTNDIYVDNTVAHSGTNSLRLYGVLGGCLGAVASRALNISPPWEVVCYVKNGGERGTGCHPQLGSIAVNTGPSWTYPAMELVGFRAALGETSQLQIQSPADGSWLSVGTFSTNRWYKVAIQFLPIHTDEVSITYLINNGLLASYTYTNLSSTPGSFTYLSIAAEEGTAWFVDIRVTGTPLVTITAPTNDAVVAPASSIAIEANASEIGGSIEEVDFFADGTQITNATQAPYSAVWSNLTAGDHTLVATAVDSQGFIAISLPVDISVEILPPVVTWQPTNVVTSQGAGASFSVGATGSGLGYQWQFNGQAIPGATGPTITLASAWPTNSGDYSVIASNSAGVVTSSVAGLVVYSLKSYAGLTVTSPGVGNWSLQASPSFPITNWTTLTNVSLQGLPFLYIDFSSPTNPIQFYRAWMPP